MLLCFTAHGTLIGLIGPTLSALQAFFGDRQVTHMTRITCPEGKSPDGGRVLITTIHVILIQQHDL